MKRRLDESKEQILELNRVNASMVGLDRGGSRSPEGSSEPRVYGDIKNSVSLEKIPPSH